MDGIKNRLQAKKMEEEKTLLVFSNSHLMCCNIHFVIFYKMYFNFLLASF
jgi:hypothetical protein